MQRQARRHRGAAQRLVDREVDHVAHRHGLVAAHLEADAVEHRRPCRSPNSRRPSGPRPRWPDRIPGRAARTGRPWSPRRGTSPAARSCRTAIHSGTRRRRRCRAIASVDGNDRVLDAARRRPSDRPSRCGDTPSRSPSSARTLVMAACCATSPPSCCGRRISTVFGLAEGLQRHFAKAEIARGARACRPGPATCGARTSIIMPPAKSMPKLRPLMATSAIDPSDHDDRQARRRSCASA